MSMPVVAAQLILLTAAENTALVGTDGFGSFLPLAAQGPGEPLVTAAGVLGTMLIWRSYYSVYLDYINFRTMGGSRLNQEQEAVYFEQTIRALLFFGFLAFFGLKVASGFENGMIL